MVTKIENSHPGHTSGSSKCINTILQVQLSCKSRKVHNPFIEAPGALPYLELEGQGHDKTEELYYSDCLMLNIYPNW